MWTKRSCDAEEAFRKLSKNGRYVGTTTTTTRKMNHYMGKVKGTMGKLKAYPQPMHNNNSMIMYI